MDNFTCKIFRLIEFAPKNKPLILYDGENFYIGSYRDSPIFFPPGWYSLDKRIDPILWAEIPTENHSPFNSLTCSSELKSWIQNFKDKFFDGDRLTQAGSNVGLIFLLSEIVDYLVFLSKENGSYRKK